VFKKVIGQDLNDPSRQTPAKPAPPVILRHAEAAAHQTPPQGSGQAPPSQPSISRPPAGSTRNILSSDVEIKGTIKFTNDLLVDGKIEGEVASDGNLTVGENARIKAEIRTATVVVYGKVQGNITATDRIELKSSAEVIGDIKTKTLSIEAGAVFVGRSTVGTPVQAVAQAGKPGQPNQSNQPNQSGRPGQPNQSNQSNQPGKPGQGGAPKQGNLPGAV
jgi:cytoskeletal protein CcmA (bactofilin family)